MYDDFDNARDQVFEMTNELVGHLLFVPRRRAKNWQSHTTFGSGVSLVSAIKRGEAKAELLFEGEDAGAVFERVRRKYIAIQMNLEEAAPTSEIKRGRLYCVREFDVDDSITDCAKWLSRKLESLHSLASRVLDA